MGSYGSALFCFCSCVYAVNTCAVGKRAREGLLHGPRDDVGGVEAAPEPHLQDGHVHVLLQEHVEPHEEQQPEVPLRTATWQASA